MQAIWKFELAITDINVIYMPIGAKVLHLDTQFGEPCIWALIPDTMAREEERFFRVYGTGHRHENIDSGIYIGTIKEKEDRLIWHVFEERK